MKITTFDPTAKLFDESQVGKKDLYSICKASDVPEDKAGVVNFVLTKMVEDRDGDYIVPMGVDMKSFAKNPVFLWAHDMSSPPIGKVLMETVKVTQSEITADVQFDMDDPFAASIYRKYREGYLNAGSIRFIPKKIGDQITPDQRGFTFEETELLEFSAVPVPANQESLAMEIRMAKALAHSMDPDTGKPSVDGWIKHLIETREDSPSESEARTEDDPSTDPSNKAFTNIKLAISLLREVIEDTENTEDTEDTEDTDTVDSVDDSEPKDYVVEFNAYPLKSNRGIQHPEISKLSPEMAPCCFAFVKHVGEAGGMNLYENMLPHHRPAEDNSGPVTYFKDVADAMISFLSGDYDDVISPEHHKGVYDHLAAHYEEFGAVPPDYIEPETEEVEPDEEPTEAKDLDDLSLPAAIAVELIKLRGARHE